MEYKRVTITDKKGRCWSIQLTPEQDHRAAEILNALPQPVTEEQRTHAILQATEELPEPQDSPTI